MKPVQNYNLYVIVGVKSMTGFSSAIQSCNSRMATDLLCNLDVPGLSTSYEPLSRHTPWRQAVLNCRAE
ncbi:hypothetical protein TNCV_2089611 [Trichonephila clavipes]|nr:hypothetical protein TNCV_2089611 [Trichonephila clavipes]